MSYPILSRIVKFVAQLTKDEEGGQYGAPFPHCDQRVLHKPGECEICDHYPHYQALREAWGISFTGHSAEALQSPDTLPCPAEMGRPLETINHWGGNTPKKEGEGGW